MDKVKIKLSTRIIAVILALMSLLPSSFITALAAEITGNGNNTEGVSGITGDPVTVPDTPSDNYPIMPMANPGSANPSAEMKDNFFLDALAYTGYDVQAQRSSNTLFVQGYYASKTPANVTTGIPYGTGNEGGLAVVTDSSTKTGYAPNIAKFKSGGLECGSYVSYVFLNYMPNIKGRTYDGLAEQLPSGTNSPGVWLEALKNLTAQGKATEIPISKPDYSRVGNLNTNDASQDIDWVDWDTLKIGDIIIFGASDSDIRHIAIYAGTCNNGWRTTHFITHVGNSRGPEISEARYMAESGDKSSVPMKIYRLEPTESKPGWIQVTKKTTSGTVEGWQFTVYSDAACEKVVDTITTGSDGTGTSKELDVGTYYVKETGYPSTVTDEQKAYWKLDTSVKTVAVVEDEVTKTTTSGYPLTFNNSYNGSLKIIKTTTNGGRVDGWWFWISTNPDIANANYPAYSGQTNSSGEVVIEGLAPGTYYICEHSPYPDYYDEKTWKLDTRTLSVTVEAGKTATVTFQNTYGTSGKLSITKTSTNGGTVEGWQFTIYSDPDCTHVVQTITTDASGYAESGELTSDVTYYIKETGTPSGVDTSYWKLDTSVKSVTVVSGTTTAVATAFTNEFFGKLSVKKNTTNGGTVAGWVFTVYSDASCTQTVTTLTTGADGTAVSGKLNPGTYYVKETGTPGGIDLQYWTTDSSIKTVTVTAGHTTDASYATFTNEFYGKLSVKKVSTNGGTVEGWQFTIYSDSSCEHAVATLTTGADGTAVSDKLNPGTYYIKETGTPGGVDTSYWKLDTSVKSVTVVSGTTTAVATAFTNEFFGKLSVKKNTTNGGTVAGWVFTVYSDASCEHAVATLTTGSDGTAVSDKLNPGTYYVKETGAPGGIDTSYWKLDTSVKSVTVVSGTTTAVSAAFTNEFYGKLSVKKNATNGGTVAGWVFTVYSDASCTQTVTTLTTGADGTVVSGKLNPGTYYIKETGTPGGIDLQYWTTDSSIKTVTVTAGHTTDASYATFTNEFYGKLSVKKVSTNGGTVEGWQFTIYSDSSCEHAVATLTTGADGTAVADKLNPGTYYIKETGTPGGIDLQYWTTDSSVKTVTVTAGQTTDASYATFANKYYGRVKITKTLENPEYGTLSGWTFEVRDSKGVLVGTYVSGSGGTITTDKLEPGVYTVTEIIDSNSVWYCVSENPQTVTVTAGQTASVTFDNALRPGKITVEKTDDSGMILPGAEFLLEWSSDGVTWQPVSYTDAEYVKIGCCTSEGLKNGVLIVGADGFVVFEGLYPLHYYRLTEIAAPNGYQLLTSPAFEGQLRVDENLEASFRVVNRPLPALPSTGGNGFTFLPYAAVFAAGIGSLLLNRGKKKRKAV